EGSPAAEPKGRRRRCARKSEVGAQPFASKGTPKPMSDEETFVGLDVGRMIRGALVTSEGRVLSEHRIVSEITDRRVFIDQLASVINQLSQGSGANAAGVGWAGMVNYSQQRVAANTNLLDVSPFDLRAELERSTGLPIVLDNDANVAAY